MNNYFKMDFHNIKIIYLFKNIKGTMDMYMNGSGPDTSLMGWNHLNNFGLSADYIDMDYKPAGKYIFEKIHNFAINQFKDLFVIFKIRNYDAVFLSHSLKIVLLLKSVFRNKKIKIYFYNINLRSILRNNSANKLKYWMIKWAIKKIDIIICPSESQIQYLINAGFDSDKLFFIPTGIDLDFINRNKPEYSISDEMFILSVGHDNGRDYQTLINIVNDLPVKLIIVAKPNNIPSEAVVGNNIKIQTMPYKQLLTLYSKSMFVVVPTVDENKTVYQSDCSGHTVILDAMACGKAVIVSERSTLRHLIEDGNNGIIVVPQNPAALRAAMLRLISDSVLCQRMGDVSLKKVGKFSTYNFAKELSQIIKSIIL